MTIGDSHYIQVGEVRGIPVLVTAEFWAVLSADMSVHVDAAVRVECLLRPLGSAVTAAMGAGQGPEDVRFTARIPTGRCALLAVECGLEMWEDDLCAVVHSELPELRAARQARERSEARRQHAAV